MKHLKSLNEARRSNGTNLFPDVFGDGLKRRSTRLLDTHVDDPSKRKIVSGLLPKSSPEHPYYMIFLDILTEVGLPDPLKSVHMVYGFEPYTVWGKYVYKVVPKKGAKFGYSKNFPIGQWFWTGGFSRRSYFEKMNDVFEADIKEYLSGLKSKRDIGIIYYDELKEWTKNKKVGDYYLYTESPCEISQILSSY